jgi:hypothetical protein
MRNNKSGKRKLDSTLAALFVAATSPEMWGPITPELTEALPGFSIINRTTVNVFDEPQPSTSAGGPV